jgi:hypothetical protein
MKGTDEELILLSVLFNAPLLLREPFIHQIAKRLALLLFGPLAQMRDVEIDRIFNRLSEWGQPVLKRQRVNL